MTRVLRGQGPLSWNCPWLVIQPAVQKRGFRIGITPGSYSLIKGNIKVPSLNIFESDGDHWDPGMSNDAFTSSLYKYHSLSQNDVARTLRLTDGLA